MTGGFYACNTFQKNKEEGKYNQDEDIRKRAEKHLEKYTHYYERWAGNESSRKQAVNDLKHMQRTTWEDLVTYEGQLRLSLSSLQRPGCR